MRRGIVTDYAQVVIIGAFALIFVGLGIAGSFTSISAAPFNSPLPPVPNQLQVSAWMPTSWDGDAARASFDAHMDSLNVISPFWYGIHADGSLVAFNGSRDIALVQQARNAGVRVIPTITNQFNQERIHAILNDPALAATHRQTIIAEVERYGYDGIALDYENLAAEDKDLFSAWAAALADDLHARGKLLTITVQPKTFDADGWDGPGAQDYRALAAAGDELRLMTYGWCWSSGCVGGDPPGPIAPIHWMQRVVNYAKTQAPAEKLVLGVHLYGYDWSVEESLTRGRSIIRHDENGRGPETESGKTCVAPWAPGPYFPGWPQDGNPPSSEGLLGGAMGASAAGVALVWEEANALQQEQGAALQWWEADDLGLVQEPWFSYAEGARHVTFANADSVEARAQLARDAGLRGVILWRLGGEDPGLWDRLPRRIHRTWLPTLSTTP